MPETTKRVCLLTGAGGQLGTAFCKLLAHRYQIVAAYRSRPPDVPSQLHQLVDPIDPAARIPENEHPVYAVRADLEDDRDVDRLVEVALARFDRVDVLINAAG